jgi:hypothetical protein
MLATMPGPRKRDRGGSRATAALLLLLCGAFAASALVAVVRHELALQVLFAEWFVPIEAALAAGVLANGVALVLLLARWRAAPPVWRPRLPLRALVYLLLGASVAYLLALQPYRGLVAHVCFGLAAGLAGFAALCGEALLRRLPPRLVSVADLVLFLVCLAAVAGELTLRAIASGSSSPLFARSSDTMLDFLARYRLRPEQATPGFPVNSQGHVDVEFGAREPGVPRAATIGDSFSTGVVPHRYHFTTVAERNLGRGEVCNIGIAGMGLNEYLYLLREEALPLQPDVVVIDLFVGNDLVDNLSGNVTPGWVEQWLDRDRLLLLVVPRRLWVSRELQDGTRPMATRPGLADLEELDFGRLYPWLSDPAREIPTFTPERFEIVERHRAQSACRPDAPPDWARVFELLLEMRDTAAAHATPFAVMLIPDEFQVEDDVWAQVVSGPESVELDRDLPQRVLAEWLAEQDIPCLDLLPALRAVVPMADGRRHLYHFRDTHFNARGNQVAGEELATFLRRWWR